ncbi:MAG TPA: hypothetical protein DEQ43_21360 [Nocardioides bacterium]|uniref:hypothetical protein n=1 Tax=uncultured Nocardioides sp. TaxID=198441 RepID=UPI000EC6C077|nr:hypothetical protein [uncultured Nocardioides sp.]HCB06755.1 hypothetical protein [Nocardioides sp.]HRD61589.1 hypothetical protein [Nocardioides sp.]
MPPAAPEYAVPTGLPPAVGGGVPVGRTLGVVAVVLALVAAGLVGWQFLRPRGGADSPEEAVRSFLDAAVHQDVLGALDLVNPAEVEGLDDLVAATRERLSDEGLTARDGDLTDALSVSVEDLEFETDELGDAAARVVLSGGSYTVTYDPGELPDRLGFVAEKYPDAETWTGDLLEDIGWELPDVDYRNDRPEPFVSAVEIDGRWYVSAVGTFVDAYLGVPNSDELRDEGIRPPDYDAIVADGEPIVAEEPEDVLDNLADAASHEDVAELLAQFPADQVAMLRPWAITIEDALADDGVTFDVSLDGVDTSVEELGGDMVRLRIREGSVYGSYEESDGGYGSGSANVDGRCVSATDDDGDEEGYCLEGGDAEDLGIDSVYLVLRIVDGGYQIDPIATAVDYASSVIESVPSRLIGDALKEIEENT